MIEIDANGLSCPEPVLLLKKAMEGNDSIRLLVDNRASSEICRRFAESRGCRVEVARTDGGYVLEIIKHE